MLQFSNETAFEKLLQGKRGCNEKLYKCAKVATKICSPN